MKDQVWSENSVFMTCFHIAELNIHAKFWPARTSNMATRGRDQKNLLCNYMAWSDVFGVLVPMGTLTVTFQDLQSTFGLSCSTRWAHGPSTI
jgi:hypothetical protein